MTQLRDLKELRFRSSGPALPPTVLEAAKLKIDPEGQGEWRLPAAYRAFLSKRDGGRLLCGGFKSDGKTWIIEGFYAFADAANQAERLRKAGKLPEGILPVAFSANERPLIFLELTERGRVYLKTSPRARWEDERAVYVIAKDFAAFLDMLGDPNTLDAPEVAAAEANPWGIAVPTTPPVKPVPPQRPRPATKKKAAKKKA
ncbi:MAG: SMI1/KNR4 family protein, partial [Planctomycetota bacterium]